MICCALTTTTVSRGNRRSQHSKSRSGSGSPIFEQKQVDILLATDIVLLSAKRQVSEIVIVSGDSDFLPAVKIARDEGVVVRLAHGLGNNRPHNELWDMADERVELT